MFELIHNTQGQMSIKQYRKRKLQMLDEFEIELSDTEMQHLNELETEIAIDNFCISMIRKYIKTHK